MADDSSTTCKRWHNIIIIKTRVSFFLLVYCRLWCCCFSCGCCRYHCCCCWLLLFLLRYLCDFVLYLTISKMKEWLLRTKRWKRERRFMLTQTHTQSIALCSKTTFCPMTFMSLMIFSYSILFFLFWFYCYTTATVHHRHQRLDDDDDESGRVAWRIIFSLFVDCDCQERLAANPIHSAFSAIHFGNGKGMLG